MSLEEDRDKIIQATAQKKLTHVVHNAATIEPFTNLSTLSLEDYRYQHSVNTEAPLFLTQKLLPSVAKGCRFLFIVSGAAFSPFQGIGSYSISKAALEMTWRAFKQEYEDTDTAFFAGLRPGGVNTDMVALANQQPSGIYPIIDQIKQRLKEGSLLEPDTVAQFITWVLFQTTNAQFEKSWNINDDEDKKSWHQHEKFKITNRKTQIR